MSRQLITETITTECRLKCLMPEWQGLFERRASTPFADPRLILAWWHARGRKQGQTLHIVTGRMRNELVAVAPLSVIRRCGVRFLHWAGDKDYDYCDTLLDDPAFAFPLWHAVRQSGGFDIAVLKNIRLTTQTHSDLARFARVVRSKHIFRVRNRWASSGDWAGSVLSSKWLKRTRYIERKLGVQAPPQLEIIVRPDDPRLVDLCETLARQKSGWTETRATSDGMPLDEKGGRATVLLNVARSAGESGTLHISCLRCGSSVLAVHLGFVHDGTFYYYMPSYDLAWSRLSPGKLLMLQLIGWAVDNRCQYFDFMCGDHTYKAEFANDRFRLTDFTFAGSLAGHALEPALNRWYFRTSLSEQRLSAGIIARLLTRSTRM